MAEKILTTVIDEAIRRVGSDESVNEIRMAVDDILNEIENCGMKVVSVEQRCIILRVECTSFYHILQLLEFIEDPKFQSRLNKLTDALTGLKTDLQHPLELALRISKKSVDSLLACIRDEDAEAKRKISLSVQCPTVAGLASFWNFTEEGIGASRVERLSKTLSKHLGKTISITLSLNQEQLLQTLQDAEAPPIHEMAEAPPIHEMAEAPPIHEMAEDEMAGASVLTFEELKKYFCHSGKYFESGPKWPNETIIYYQVFRESAEENQAQQVGDDQLAAQFKQLNVKPQWYRVINKTAYAEGIMIEQLERRQEIQALGEKDTLRIRMVVSYSPCNKCSDLLLNFKNGIEEKGAHVEINIKIANFYLHEKETRGLCKLPENVFKLSVFDGENDWKEFYTDVTGKEISEPFVDEDRLAREQKDKSILAEINRRRTGIAKT